MDEYIEVTIVWEGAVDQVESFDLDGTPVIEGPATFDALVSAAKADAERENAQCAIYVTWHCHDPFDDTECICSSWDTNANGAYWAHSVL